MTDCYINKHFIFTTSCLNRHGRTNQNFKSLTKHHSLSALLGFIVCAFHFKILATAQVLWK